MTAAPTPRPVPAGASTASLRPRILPSGTAHGRRPRRSAVSMITAVLALALSLVLTACGVRLETPPLSEPVPDANELVRETAVSGALETATLASAAATTPGAAVNPTLVTALTEIADRASRQAAQLGGPYESGLADNDDDTEAGGDDVGASPGATPSLPPTSTPADVLAALGVAAAAGRSGADTTTDGDLARLLASVSASQDASVRQLAALLNSQVPPSERPATPAVPPELPSGLSATDLSTIIAAEDAAGYAYEVRAAQTDGDARAAALARAVLHRARAQAWVDVAGTSDTDQDPRRVAYAVPDGGLDDLAQQLEASLAESYASLVAHAATGSRAALSDLLDDAAASAVAWGQPITAFPGLPEQD